MKTWVERLEASMDEHLFADAPQRELSVMSACRHSLWRSATSFTRSLRRARVRDAGRESQFKQQAESGNLSSDVLQSIGKVDFGRIGRVSG